MAAFQREEVEELTTHCLMIFILVFLHFSCSQNPERTLCAEEGEWHFLNEQMFWFFPLCLLVAEWNTEQRLGLGWVSHWVEKSSFQFTTKEEIMFSFLHLFWVQVNTNVCHFAPCWVVSLIYGSCPIITPSAFPSFFCFVWMSHKSVRS